MTVPNRSKMDSSKGCDRQMAELLLGAEGISTLFGPNRWTRQDGVHWCCAAAEKVVADRESGTARTSKWIVCFLPILTKDMWVPSLASCSKLSIECWQRTVYGVRITYPFSHACASQRPHRDSAWIHREFLVRKSRIYELIDLPKWRHFDFTAVITQITNITFFLLRSCFLSLVLASTIGSHIFRFEDVVSLQVHSCNEMGFPSFFSNIKFSLTVIARFTS